METSFDLLKALWDTMPVLGLMAVVIWALWSEKKELKGKNEELNVYIRESLLNTLNGVKSTMDKVIDVQANGDEQLKSKITQEAAELKNHITLEIAKIERGK